MTEGPRVNFEKRFAHYEIYTWTLCHSYLHEKQTSRIQSLNLQLIWRIWDLHEEFVTYMKKPWLTWRICDLCEEFVTYMKKPWLTWRICDLCEEFVTYMKILHVSHGSYTWVTDPSRKSQILHVMWRICDLHEESETYMKDLWLS